MVKEFIIWNKLDSDIKQFAKDMQYLRNLDKSNAKDVKESINTICSITEELSLHSDILCKSYRAKRLAAEAGLQLINLSKNKNEFSTKIHN